MKFCMEEKIMVFCRFWLLVVIAGMLLYPVAAHATGPVSGHYIKGEGQDIKLALQISAPAPLLVIVVQHLPEGVEVVTATPKLKKYNPDRGVAKWLLRKAVPGEMLISLHLDRPVKLGEINGEIRYRDAAGKMASVPLAN